MVYKLTEGKVLFNFLTLERRVRFILNWISKILEETNLTPIIQSSKIQTCLCLSVCLFVCLSVYPFVTFGQPGNSKCGLIQLNFAHVFPVGSFFMFGAWGQVYVMTNLKTLGQASNLTETFHAYSFRVSWLWLQLGLVMI